MLFIISTILSLQPVAQPEIKPFSPAAAVRLASVDAANLSADVARRTRYLMLTGQTAHDRKKLYQVLAVHVNILSREPDLVRPVVVLDNGGAVDGLGDGIVEAVFGERVKSVGAAEYKNLVDSAWGHAALLRLNIDDYGWPKETWESLQEDDPYFHVKLNSVVAEFETVTVTENIQWPGGIWKTEDGGDGKFYERGVYARKRDVKQQKKSSASSSSFALAPWLTESAGDKLALAQLTAVTVSQSPVLRADWFLWETGIQADRKVGYYGFLGVKNRADFQRLVGFDRRLSEAFTRELLASVANSGVAQQPRRFAFFDKIGGQYITSFDNDLAVDKANPIRVLNEEFKHKAEEVFAHGSNGLWKVGLFAADGTRQDSAPDFVGFDKTSHNNDGRIHVGLSCFRCHQSVKGEDGLKEIKDWSRILFQPPLALTGPDYGQIKKLRQQYLRRLEPSMSGDRARHNEAVRECSGLTPFEWATALADRWAVYDSPVDIVRAASDLGIGVAEWKQAVDAYTKRAGQIDTVLGMYSRPLAQQEPLPLTTWHESYSSSQAIFRSIR